MSGEKSQLISWSLIFDGIDLGGMNGGLADGDAIKIGPPEATPIKLTKGASNDTIITSDIQSFIRPITIRTIVGLTAYNELQKRAFIQLKEIGAGGPITYYSGSAIQSYQANGSVQFTKYTFSVACFSTFPEHVLKNANSDTSHSIVEFELTADVDTNSQG